MGLLSTLDQYVNSEESLFHQFLLKYRFDNDTIHMIFEGYEDPSYYLMHYRKFFKQKFQMYIANGKGNIYGFHETIDWDRFEKGRVFIFTDRDYNELVGEALLEDDNIYITDYYSIENHVVSRQVLESVAVEILHLNDVAVINDVLTTFDKSYSQFHKTMLYVSSWIILMRRKGHKVNLGNVKVSELCNVTDALHVKGKGGVRLEYLTKVTGCVQEDDIWPELRQTILELKEMPPKKIIRGKFERWFFIKFIQGIRKLLEGKGIRVKLNTELNDSNLIEVLAPRMEIPNSLKDFFLRHSRKVA